MKVLNRLLSSLGIGMLMFLILCCLNRVIQHDWILLNSALWSAGWAIGDFSAQSFAKLRLRAAKLILLNLIMSIFVIIVLVFLIGLILKVPNWIFVVYHLSFGYILALFVRSKWRK